MKNPELKKQFEEEFIPSLERMLDKENAHLDKLELFKKENGHTVYIENAIYCSRDSIIELEYRLKEYKNYTKNL